MHIEEMIDKDGESYYDVSNDAMEKILNLIECISTDGFIINEEVQKEAQNILNMIK